MPTFQSVFLIRSEIPTGHSFSVAGVPVKSLSLHAANFWWGIDLFNHGFYWEAHEAWEPLWRASEVGDPRRVLLKALILLAAAGVKLLEGNKVGLNRHAMRAAALFSQLADEAPN